MSESKSAEGSAVELQPRVEEEPEKEEDDAGGDAGGGEDKELFQVQVMLIIFGIASLFPWNIIINSAGYFKIRMKGTRFETTYPNFIQFIGILCNLTGSFSNVFLSKRFSARRLAFISNIIMTAPMGIMAILARVDSSSWAEEFFVLNLVAIAMSGIGHGIQTSSVSALVAMIKPELLKRYYIGKGVAGLIAVGVTLITLSFPGLDVERAAFYYFSLTLILCTGGVTCLMYKFINMDYVLRAISNKGEKYSEEMEPKEEVQMSTLELLKKGKEQCAAVFIIIMVTLTIFPAVATNVKQIHPSPGTKWTDVYYSTVSIFLAYNIGDTTGKFMSGIFLWPGKHLILYVALTRLVLVPMIIMCNIQPRTIPVWFNEDAIPSLIIFTTALTSGHMMSLCLSYAPSYVEGKANKARVSTVTYFFASMGMVLASCSIFLVTALINI